MLFDRSGPAIRGVALVAALAGLALAGGCQTKPKPGSSATVVVGPPLKAGVWQSVASAADRDRIDRLGLAWSAGLAEAGKSNRADIRREGPLLMPRSALPRPDPTPGSYNCRLIQLGRAGAKGRTFESFKPFFCYIQLEDDQLTFVKQTGSQRPAGRLWDDDDSKRMIFLGSIAMGAQDKTLAYGDDTKRDMAGVLERVAPFKWRLVIPWPQGSSKIDIYELTPVADQPE